MDTCSSETVLKSEVRQPDSLTVGYASGYWGSGDRLLDLDRGLRPGARSTRLSSEVAPPLDCLERRFRPARKAYLLRPTPQTARGARDGSAPRWRSAGRTGW